MEKFCSKPEGHQRAWQDVSRTTNLTVATGLNRAAEMLSDDDIREAAPRPRNWMTNGRTGSSTAMTAQSTKWANCGRSPLVR
jgi:hypothetical protein